MVGRILVVLSLGLSGGSSEPVPVERGQLFETADRCMACHNSLVTEDGRDVSIGTRWRATMMANAARDPYWQATIRAETLDHPAASAAPA